VVYKQRQKGNKPTRWIGRKAEGQKGRERGGEAERQRGRSQQQGAQAN
jgi:hypothetical protein